jgi:hypothetical protein
VDRRISGATNHVGRIANVESMLATGLVILPLVISHLQMEMLAQALVAKLLVDRYVVPQGENASIHALPHATHRPNAQI